MSSQSPDIDELIARLQGLKLQNIELLVKRQSLLDRAREKAEERNELNKAHSELAAQIRGLKVERGKLLEKLKAAKESRDLIRQRMADQGRIASELRSQLRDTMEPVQGSASEIEGQIRELEWKIQTMPLPPSAEKQMVERIVKLSEQLSRLRKAEEIKAELENCRTVTVSLRSEARSLRNQMIEVRQQIGDIRVKMIELIERASSLRSQADEAHRAALEARSGADRLYEQYVANLAEIKKLREELHRRRTDMEVSKGRQVRERLEKSAVEKIRRGGRLTLEELKVLMGETD